MREEIKRIKEKYERYLVDVEYLIRNPTESTKEMESINIRDREVYSDLDGIMLYLLEVKSNLGNMELKMRKV